jgi:hypothetical protein
MLKYQIKMKKRKNEILKYEQNISIYYHKKEIEQMKYILQIEFSH